MLLPSLNISNIEGRFDCSVEIEQADATSCCSTNSEDLTDKDDFDIYCGCDYFVIVRSCSFVTSMNSETETDLSVQIMTVILRMLADQ
jgi:hypothetical protein